ncbi:hypothetical protein OKW45_006746 [Paraburkholderia sp. WSM4175]
MTALSLTGNVRGHGFQMHHYPSQARGPAYELAVLAVFFAYFLCSSKESRCRPAQGQR